MRGVSAWEESFHKYLTQSGGSVERGGRVCLAFAYLVSGYGSCESPSWTFVGKFGSMGPGDGFQVVWIKGTGQIPFKSM